MDAVESKALCEPSQAGFNFPSLDESSINNAYFPDPVTGMNAARPSNSIIARWHGPRHPQSWRDHTPGFISDTVLKQNLHAAHVQPESDKPTAAPGSSDPHARNTTKPKQLLLLAALNNLLNPATHSFPVNYPTEIRRPPPPHHGCAPAVAEPCRMTPSPTYRPPASQIAYTARPPSHVDPRRIPADIAAIIAAAAASMERPSAPPARAGSLHRPPSAAAAAAAAATSTSMPPPPPRAPQRGCACEGGVSRRRQRPVAVEALSLGPGDPDSCRPTARRRVCGGGADPAGGAEPLRARPALGAGAQPRHIREPAARGRADE
jgi:hypothetical protein